MSLASTIPTFEVGRAPDLCYDPGQVLLATRSGLPAPGFGGLLSLGRPDSPCNLRRPLLCCRRGEHTIPPQISQAPDRTRDAGAPFFVSAGRRRPVPRPGPFQPPGPAQHRPPIRPAAQAQATGPHSPEVRACLSTWEIASQAEARDRRRGLRAGQRRPRVKPTPGPPRTPGRSTLARDRTAPPATCGAPALHAMPWDEASRLHSKDRRMKRPTDPMPAAPLIQALRGIWVQRWHGRTLICWDPNDCDDVSRAAWAGLTAELHRQKEVPHADFPGPEQTG